MRLIKYTIAAALAGSATAAPATTVIIYIEPMTLERYTRVFDTPGPDRAFMCPAPPAVAGCTAIPIKRGR